MDEYLQASAVIDWQSRIIVEQAATLANGARSKEEIAKRCFEFVRDQIKHSTDYQLNPVTCKASDVLIHGTGFCYAKSHLLAALLRANGIAAGMCYQRLTVTDDKPPFCLHGLNAVYLADYGWYRIDARGNKPTVSAEFCPPIEKLAFPIITEGEFNLADIFAEPLPSIVEVLTRYDHFQDVAENLPDVVD